MKIRAVAWLATAVSLTGCGTLDRLSEVGRDPAMTPTADPTKDPKWRPLSMPMPSVFTHLTGESVYLSIL
jgi:flagellar L-ring protein FlgH